MMPALPPSRKNDFRLRPAGYVLLAGLLLFTLPLTAFADRPGQSTHEPSSPPESDRTETSQIFIDELSPLVSDGRLFLRIEGHLPTPCHNLGIPEWQLRRDTLSVSMNSWQKSGQMCAQVLEHFVYYMEISEPGTPEPQVIRLNDHTVSLK